MRQRILIASACILLTAAGFASAESPQWRYGGRLSWVSAGTTSDPIDDSGSALDLSSGLGAEFDATLMFSDLFGVEFSIGASAHRLEVTGGDVGTVDAGRLWLVPLTAIGQYHVPIYGPWGPYVGLGVTWALPLDGKSGDAEEAGIEEMEFEGGLAGVVQIGVNYQMDNRWYANIDLRYTGTSLDAQVRTLEEDLPTVTLNAKPFVISLGFGYKF